METAAPNTFMGIDMMAAATVMAGIAAFAVLFAIYTALAVKDPMAKRVKALQERREQLKAGITASTSKRRAKLVTKNETTDQIRDLLSSLKVLAGKPGQGRADQADAGRHPAEGICGRGHLRPAGAADRVRRDRALRHLRDRDAAGDLGAAEALRLRRGDASC